jgi:adenine phosphoribosyltransferase
MTMRPLELMEEVKGLVRDIPDFPKPGILFRDITPVLESGPTLLRVIDHFKARYAGRAIQRFVGIESRGFIFATALAYSLGVGVALIRKPGKLPSDTERMEYELEYGTDAVEIHIDAVKPGMEVVIVDDLLATGGTAEASVKLVERLGGLVRECAFVLELAALEGRRRLHTPVYSLLEY